MPTTQPSSNYAGPGKWRLGAWTRVPVASSVGETWGVAGLTLREGRIQTTLDRAYEYVCELHPDLKNLPRPRIEVERNVINWTYIVSLQCTENTYEQIEASINCNDALRARRCAREAYNTRAILEPAGNEMGWQAVRRLVQPDRRGH